MKWLFLILREVAWAAVSAVFVMWFWNHSVLLLFYHQTVLPLDFERAFCLYCLVRTLIEAPGFRDSTASKTPPPRRDWDSREPMFPRR